VATAGFVALYLWDDLILAAPIVAANRAWGTWPTLVFFTLAYGFGSFVIAMLVVRISDRHEHQHAEPGRVTRWLQKESTRRRGVWGQRLVATGSIVAFVISSVVVGGILTTWLVWLAGRREHIARTAALSSLLFGLMFTATYTGLVELVVRL
jgi:hypothetical protein